MAQFLLQKRLDLGFLGETWKDCYLMFNALTIREVREVTSKNWDLTKPDDLGKMMDDSINMLKEKFVAGEGIGLDGKPAKITADDMDSLPSEILNRAVTFVLESRETDEKKASKTE